MTSMRTTSSTNRPRSSTAAESTSSWSRRFSTSRSSRRRSGRCRTSLRCRSSPNSRSTRTRRRSPVLPPRRRRPAAEPRRGRGGRELRGRAPGRARGARRDEQRDGRACLDRAAEREASQAAPGVASSTRTTPDYFAEFAAQARNLGARIIGGCCGTTPAQIAAIRAAVEQEREPRVPMLAVERDRHRRQRRWRANAAPAEARGGGVGRLGRARSAEGDEHGRVARGCRAPAGVQRGRRHGHQRQPDGARALSALMAAVAIEQTVELETIPHVTPRDASVMGLSRAARRPCGGRAERPRRHRGPAARGRLPGVERRVRGRRDRADGARLAPKSGRGLLR